MADEVKQLPEGSRIRHPQYAAPIEHAVQMRLEVEGFVKRHPTLIDVVMADVDHMYFLARGIDAQGHDKRYREFKKIVQTARTMTDAASRNAMIFRAAFSIQSEFSHATFYGKGAFFYKFQDYLRDIAERIEAKRAKTSEPPPPFAPAPEGVEGIDW